MSTPWKISMGEASCKDVVQDLFHLKNMEMLTLCDLAKHGSSRMEDIAQRVGRDKSSIHRALQKLLACGLIYQTKHTLDRGGYFFVYETPSMDVMKKKLLRCADDWYQSVKSSIDDFDGFQSIDESDEAMPV